ncbi:hypothetical protein [Enterococcus avium]
MRRSSSDLLEDGLGAIVSETRECPLQQFAAMRLNISLVRD